MRLITIILVTMALALSACGKKPEPKTAPVVYAKTQVEKILPSAKPVVRKHRAARARAHVLPYSCTVVRLAVRTMSRKTIETLERSNAKRRGLTEAQRAQQRREAMACLR